MKDRWVAADRPPEGIAQVIVAVRSDSGWRGIGLGCYLHAIGEWRFAGNGNPAQPLPSAYEVTHWMPTPELPGGTADEARGGGGD